MLKWQHLFSNSVLAHGRTYYRSGRVNKLEKIDTTYFAEVHGTRKYHVIITLRGETISNMECSCLYADSGEHCKHMAAVLYSIQNYEMPLRHDIPHIRFAEDEKKQRSKLKNVFYEPKAGEYRFYRLNRILNHQNIYSDTLEKAKKLLAGGIENFRHESGYLQGSAMYGTIKSFSVWYRTLGPQCTASVTLSGSGLQRCTCATPRCRAYYTGVISNGADSELCEHVVALLLLADEYLKLNDNGDTTDYSAKQMIEAFSERGIFSAATAEKTETGEMRPGRTIILQPRLSRQYDGLTLSFRTGADKLYIVRNMAEFVEAVENKACLALGKLCTIDFAVDKFDDTSKKYYRLMRSIVRDEQYRREYNRDFAAPPKNDTMLYGSTLDSFFEIAEDSMVAFSDRLDEFRSVKERSISVLNGTPDVGITIKCDTDSEGVFHGIVLNSSIPEFYDGVKHRYFIKNDSLQRVRSDKLTGIESLIQMFSSKDTIRIGRNYLTEFYQNVLPEIRSYAAVDEPDWEIIDDYLPPEAIFSFYLDSENGIPRCRTMVEYGEKCFNAVRRISSETGYDRTRNYVREDAVLAAVTKYFPDLDRENAEYIALQGDDSMYLIMSEGIENLRRYGEVFSTARFSSMTVRRSISIKMGVSVDSSIMNLQINSDVSDEELLELLKSYREKMVYF